MTIVRNTDTQWGVVSIFFHWSLAIMILCMIGLGLVAVNWPLSPTKLELFIWHKSIGILILALVLLRLVWRLVNKIPTLPAAIPKLESKLARAGHFFLYFFMIAMPISGWIINSAANFPLKWFGVFRLPNIWSPSKIVEDYAKYAHLILFILFALLLIAHISAALRHHFYNKNNILVRMLPILNRSSHV